MSKIQLCVFDMAGTTVEDVNFVADALVKAFNCHGFSLTVEHANRKMGIPKPIAIRELLSEKYDLKTDETSLLVEAIHKYFEEAMCEFYARDNCVRAVMDAEATFSILHEAGIKVFLDTGFNRPIADIIIRKLGWIERGLIDGIVTSDEVKKGRPAPDLIFKAMNLSGISDSASVAKIGDTVSDLEEGTSANCGLVIGITTGAQSEQLLSRAPHTHLCASLSEAVQIILDHK